LKYRELAGRLKDFNCLLDRSAKGSHEIWINSSTGARTTIPNWGNKDLKPGTIAGILKDLGIESDNFYRRSK